VKKLFRFIRRAFSAIWSSTRRFVAAIFRAPAAAFARWARRMRDRLAQLFELVITLWNRIWQRNPGTTVDAQPTPGRVVLPLVAGTVTTTLWYLLPLVEWLNLDAPGFIFGLGTTWVVALLVARTMLRQSPPTAGSTWLHQSHRRTGLIRWEQVSTISLWVSIGFTLRQGNLTLLPALLMLAVGFTTLLAGAYRDRPLTDALPITGLFEPDEAGMDGAVDDGERLVQQFRWRADVGISPADFDAAVAIVHDHFVVRKSENPAQPVGGHQPDWTPWVVSGSGPEVSEVARQIRVRSNDLAMTRFEEAASVLAFAQSIPYSTDLDTTGQLEYWRYPIETMYEKTGDCEDLSILAAAVLRKLGHHVLPLVTTDHAAIGIAAPPGLPGTYIHHEGRSYYYCETTAEGLKIGDLPPGVAADEIIACPLREEAVR
jgi:hypothetical protein